MTNVHLNGHHRKTLASIFRHPASHNVEWHDVLSLLNHAGAVTERSGGSYDVTIGAEPVVLSRPHGKDLAGDELRLLQAFLTRAGLSPEKHPVEEPGDDAAAEVASPCILMIDHHQARLFGLDGDATTPRVFKPEDADGSARRNTHKQGSEDHDGGHAPEDNAYYERISAELKGTRDIVVFSDGKGRSNAGSTLIDYLERHHPDIDNRIVASERVDISHLSDGEIVAAGLALVKVA